MGILRGEDEKKRGEWIGLIKTIDNWKTEKKKKKGKIRYPPNVQFTSI